MSDSDSDSGTRSRSIPLISYNIKHLVDLKLTPTSLRSNFRSVKSNR